MADWNLAVAKMNAVLQMANYEEGCILKPILLRSGRILEWRKAYFHRSQLQNTWRKKSASLTEGKFKTWDVYRFCKSCLTCGKVRRENSLHSNTHHNFKELLYMRNSNGLGMSQSKHTIKTFICLHYSVVWYLGSLIQGQSLCINKFRLVLVHANLYMYMNVLILK